MTILLGDIKCKGKERRYFQTNNWEWEFTWN